MGNNIENKSIAICTAFNEETRVGDFIDRFFENPKEKLIDTVLIINDGSTDKTKEIAEKHGATVIGYPKRKGLGYALRTGINYALENNYSILVFIAPNGKDNPIEIPNVTKPILNNEADYVQGSRYILKNHSTENMSFIRQFATKWHPFLIRIITGFPATDSTNGFRAIKAELFKDPRIDINQKWLDGTSFEFYVYLMAIKLKYRMVEVHVTKKYMKTVHHFNYSKSGSMTKTRPIIDWWRILKPLVLYILGKI